MSSSVASTFPAPIRETIEGQEFEFPRLDLDDLAAWCDEIHESRKIKQYKLLPPSIQGLDLFKARRAIEFGYATLDDIADLTYTPKGVTQALKRSLKKKGLPEADWPKVIKGIKPSHATDLARNIVSLFKDILPEDPDKDKGKKTNTTEPDRDGPSDRNMDRTGSVPPLDETSTEEGGG